MTRFIEASPDSFPILVAGLHNEYGNLIVEAPSFQEAASLSSSLSIFKFNTVLFAPQFLLMERGEEDIYVQEAFSKIVQGEADVVVTTPLSDRFFVPDSFEDEKLEFNVNEYYQISSIIASLVRSGYRKVPIVRDPGEFSLRGDILDIGTFIPGKGVRLEFFDEELEQLNLFRTSTQRNCKKLDFTSIPQLLFSNKLKKDWKKILESTATGLSMKEILDTEELIAQGTFRPWDIFPLISGRSTTSDIFKAKKVRWERVRGELNLESDFHILNNERIKRKKEGSFVPFDLHSYFTETVNYDIEVSALFSTADRIEKFKSSHRKVGQSMKKEPGILFKEILAEEDCAVLFAKPNEIDGFIENAEKFNQSMLHVDHVPDDPAPGDIYVIEKTPWFAHDAVFRIPELNLSLVPSDIFKVSSGKKHREIPAILPSDNESFNLDSLKPGEYVVHYNFGIGVYEGTERVSGTDCVVLRYDKDDRIFVPVYNMHYIYRYRWDEGVFPRMSSLRSNVWVNTRNRVKKDIEKVASHILELYAKRSVETSESLKVDTELYREFISSFPYKETRDQATTILDLERDLASEQITDRLLCGDVGFGKTEVAMRGCMIAASNARQSAILAPTTVLAFQHFTTFKERFADMPVRIEMLSRFYSKAKQKEVVRDLETGKIDILIGTHRILSKDIKFKNLGFLVVDEEHRFGVTHKEKIKDIKKDVATMSMTATPIPRTLQLSILGIRDVSFIKTPPVDRKNIRTYVLEYSNEIIREAITAELSRNGQIYFVHNRIASLPDIKRKLEQLVEGIRIATAHGQMDEKQLEAVMVDFVNRKYDLLLSTSLIESGIDIPRVNTIIINRADMFGLAQLYQLRGRVGRWNRQASAYLFVPSLSGISKDSLARLSVIKRFDNLGSGYDVAMEDLNIRGGGNILGFSQTGKIKGIGYEMYLELLKRRIAELKTGIPESENEFDISADISANIPEEYVPETDLRVGFYRKLSEIEKPQELAWITSTLREMFGPLPKETENLLFLILLKIKAKNAGALGISISSKEFSMTLSPTFTPKNMDALFDFVQNNRGTFTDSHSIKFEIDDIKEASEIVEGFKKATK